MKNSIRRYISVLLITIVMAFVLCSCSVKNSSPISETVSATEKETETTAPTTEQNTTEQTTKPVSKESTEKTTVGTTQKKRDNTTQKKTTVATTKEKSTKQESKSTTKATATNVAKKATSTTKSSNSNQHNISVGNMGRWFNTRQDLIDYYQSVAQEWNKKYYDDKSISREEFNKNVPIGYECYTCSHCGKWTGNFKYR